MYMLLLLSVVPTELTTLSLAGAVGLGIVAGMWAMFQKAGKPGWAAIVPLYNVYVLVAITNNGWWWIILLLGPVLGAAVIVGSAPIWATLALLFVAFGAHTKINLDLAGEFDQGIGFAAGLILLPMVFYPLLGIGNYRYDTGPPSLRG